MIELQNGRRVQWRFYVNDSSEDDSVWVFGL